MGNLGYAVTVHRAQGATVETAHILIDPARTARESLYVGMTRGRESNVAYVATDTPGLEEHQHPAEPSGAREVLTAVLARVAAEPSAHEAIRVEQDAWGGIAQLAAEYDTLAAAALADRYLGVLHRAGLDDAQLDALDGSESFTSLVAELRRLEAERHDLDALLPAAIGSRPLDDADDLGAVLYRRVQRIAPAGRSRRAPRLIAGLVPAASGVADPEMREALAERHRLIEQRAAALAETALRNGAHWTRTLGVRPAESGRANAWLTQARTVAAYRDRYRLDDDRPAGPAAATIAQRLDQARAEAAVRAARRIAADDARAGFRQTAGRRATGPTL